MKILCWLFGHKELKIKVLKDGLMTIHDLTGVLFTVKCCDRCNLLYWESKINFDRKAR